MRIFLLRVITIVMASAFLYRLFDLQVVNTSYQTLSENNAVLEIAEYPERGFIYDRNGKLLVANQPAYDMSIRFLKRPMQSCRSKCGSSKAFSFKRNLCGTTG